MKYNIFLLHYDNGTFSYEVTNYKYHENNSKTNLNAPKLIHYLIFNLMFE